jgi:predicted nucleic acid-binding protein
VSVVDASVWVARLVPQDVHYAASRAWLEQHVAAGGVVVAPVLLLAEVAGAISRRTGQPALANAAVAQLLRLPALRLIAVDRRLAHVAMQLAVDLGLGGADALYVATAHELRVPLITVDQDQLTRAAPRVTARSP